MTGNLTSHILSNIFHSQNLSDIWGKFLLCHGNESLSTDITLL